MKTEYKYLPVFFVVILILVPIGFRQYFTEITNSEFPVHFHFGVMSIWCLILIAQPILISKGKHAAHIKIGRFSYYLVPILIVSMVWVMLHSLHKTKDSLDIINNLSFIYFPSTQIILFGLFYFLAMQYKRKPKVHMRYIVISSVTLLGPTIGRINFDTIGLGGLDMDLIIMESVLAIFLITDAFKKNKLQYYGLGLILFLLVHLSLL